MRPAQDRASDAERHRLHTHADHSALYTSRDMIVPTLCVVTPLRTLRVRPWSDAVRHGCMRARSMGTISVLEIMIVPTFRVVTPLRTLRVRSGRRSSHPEFPHQRFQMRAQAGEFYA